MDARDYLKALRKGWLIVALCALAGIAVATGYSFLIPREYQAKTELYVSVRTGGTAATTDLVQGTSFARQAVTSYVSVVSSASVLDRVIDELALRTTPAALATKVTADSPLNTVLIDITVTDADPRRAAEIANSVGSNTSYVVTNELERSADGSSLVNVQTIQPATVPTKPSSPAVPLDIALGLLIGLLVGVAASVVRNLLDTRIHGADDIEEVTDSPILGAISHDPMARTRPLIVHAEPRSPRAESFRSLRTNLQFVNVGGPRSYVITSAVPGEGKSTTAANLALALAEAGARVALVDGDLRFPRLADYMGIEGAVGLTDVLIGRVGLVDVLQRWGRGQLYVLPAGRIPPNPSELLGSAVMAGVLADLSSEFDFVLVDAPPLLLVTDAAVISKITGGVILAAASGRTKKSELASSVRALEHIDSRVVGIVVTMLPAKGPDAQSYGTYGYGGHDKVFDDDMTEHRVRRAAQA